MKSDVAQQHLLLKLAGVDAELVRLAHRAAHLPEQQAYDQVLAEERAATDRLGALAVALDDAFVSAERFEEIDARRLRQYGNSLYALLERRDAVRIKLGAIQLRATLPDRETSVLLGLTDIEPLLSVTRLAHTPTGEPVEWRKRLCRSARWAFQRST